MLNSPENNPLIKAAQDCHGQIPFDKIKTEHFMPALDWAIETAKARYEAIKAVRKPSFENIMVAMEGADAELSVISSVFSNLSSVMSNAEMKKIEASFSKKLTKYSSDISLDADLFAQIKVLHDQKDVLNLAADQKKLLNDSYKSFVRRGAELGDLNKTRLREISETLSGLSVDFRQNIMKTDDAFEYWVDDLNDLKGMPQDNIDIAKEAAKDAGQGDKYLISLDASQVMAVLSYAEDRKFREDISRTWDG